MEQPIPSNTNQTQDVKLTSAPEAPIIVKAIAVCFYIVSINFLFTSISAILRFLGLIPCLLGCPPTGAEASMFSSSLVFAVFSFFAGRGLWKVRLWGRWMAIIISGLYSLSHLLTVISIWGRGYMQIFSAPDYILWGLNLAIFFYLLLNKNIKVLFAQELKIKN